jgi:hypothetical protein
LTEKNKAGVNQNRNLPERHRLEENPGAVNLELSADELKQMDEASAKIKIVGERYPEALQKWIDR